MIVGIGTDIIAVKRFAPWETYTLERLQKIYSEQELAACKKKNVFDVQKLATRFAAKEAFFKALSATLVTLGFTQQQFSFMFTCTYVEVLAGEWGVPVLHVDWQAFERKCGVCLPLLQVSVSLSHEREYAGAFVIIEKI